VLDYVHTSPRGLRKHCEMSLGYDSVFDGASGIHGRDSRWRLVNSVSRGTIPNLVDTEEQAVIKLQVYTRGKGYTLVLGAQFGDRGGQVDIEEQYCFQCMALKLQMLDLMKHY